MNWLAYVERAFLAGETCTACNYEVLVAETSVASAANG
jgi:hypothetical protein